MSLITPLARVRGLGSAKNGTHHFWYQRLTAIALIPLTLWFLASLLNKVPMDYASVTNWIGSSTLTASLLILFIIALFHHIQLGLQVIVEDYIDTEWLKIINIILIKFLAFSAGLASILAILKIYLGL